MKTGVITSRGNKYRLEKRIKRIRKFVDGAEVIKKRILHVPVDKKAHKELFLDAQKFYWARNDSSFGSHRGLNPAKYVRQISNTDLIIQFDLKDCFPSINDNMARKAMGRYTSLYRTEKGIALAETILEAVFVKTPLKNKFLAQGPNLSPMVSNCVLHGMDAAINANIRLARGVLNQKLATIRSIVDTVAGANKLPEEATAFLSRYLTSRPIIKYARYVDNGALCFWRFPDSFRDLRIARKLDAGTSMNLCESVVSAHMSIREYLWHRVQEKIKEMGLSINPTKTKFRRKYGRKAIYFVGYVLNQAPRAKKSYIEKLRCILHGFLKYLEDCDRGNVLLPAHNVAWLEKKWLKKIAGQCEWVFTVNPLCRRLKCLKDIIPLEKKILKTHALTHLSRYLN